VKVGAAGNKNGKEPLENREEKPRTQKIFSSVLGAEGKGHVQAGAPSFMPEKKDGGTKGKRLGPY